MTRLHTWRKAPVQAWCRNCLNLNLFEFVLKFRINRQGRILLCTSIKHPGNDFNLLHNWFEISNIHIAVHNGVLLVIFWFIVVVIFSPFYSVAWLLDNQFFMCRIQSNFFWRITIESIGVLVQGTLFCTYSLNTSSSSSLLSGSKVEATKGRQDFIGNQKGRHL